MYFSTPTILALIAALPAILASPLLDTRQNGLICQTSDGSPEAGDVTDVINQLRGQGGLCYQSNDSGSDCTTLVSHNNAAISICGGVDNDDSTATSCEDVAGFANQIQQECKKRNPARQGGFFQITASKKVEVIHS